MQADTKTTQPEQQEKHKTKSYIAKKVMYALHMFSCAYIVGQSFTIFNLGPISQLFVGGGSNYILEQIMLLLIFVTGIAMTYFRLKEGSIENYGRKNWLGLNTAKIVLLLLMTPITDMIAFSWSASADQTQLTASQLYTVKSFKFVFTLTAFALGIYERIYREDITENFSKSLKQKVNGDGETKEERVKEPLLKADNVSG